MGNNNFWNDAARCGAVVGGLVAVSGLLENAMVLSGRMSLYLLMLVEFVAVAVLHYYLLHRFTRQRSMLCSAEEGFTFGQGYGFVLAMSAFAGIIAGCVQAVYLHLIVGYSTYMDRYFSSLAQVLEQNGAMSSSMEGMLSQLMTQVQSSPAPSVLGTVMGGIWTSLLFGAVFGLIVAGVLARAPRPFDTQE